MIGTHVVDAPVNDATRQVPDSVFAVGPTHHPLTTWIGWFLSDLRSSGHLSSNTIKHYGHDLGMFTRYICRDAPGVHSPGDIETATVVGFLEHMATIRGNGETSNRRRLAALRKFFRYLVHLGYMQTDPTAAVALRVPGKRRPVVLTRNEALRLLEATKMSRFPYRDHAVFRLFLSCGCTLSELLGLDPGDFDADDGTLTLSGRKQSQRTLTLSPKCRRTLEEYLDHRPKAPSAGKLFLNRHGRGITKGAVYHAFRRALDRAGIRKAGLTVHSLRHTCLALLWEAGVGLHMLQQVAGHRSLSTTREYAWAGRRPSTSTMGRRRHPLDE